MIDSQRPAAGRGAWGVLPTRVLASSVLALALVRCGSTRPAETPTAPQRGGTAVLGSISDVDSWNEYTSRQDFAGKLQRRIFLRLAREQSRGEGEPPSYEPLLAESWSASTDGRALTFRLRPARWSDGVPITADDVRFTWEAQTSPGVSWVGMATKQHIQDVEAVDERVVTFHFDRVYPQQLADAVEGGILPRHVFGKVPFEDWPTHDWSTTRVGSGPFLLESHQPGHEIRLRRNPEYFKEELPLLDAVVIRIVPDAGNLLTQVLAGEVDYFEGVAPRDASRLASNTDVSFIRFDYPKFDYIGWNGARPPFDDPRLRRALTLAIDRQALVSDLLYGFGRVSKGPVLSSQWGADRSLAPWPYDPDEARRLIAELGFAAGGRALEFELITNAGNALREAVAVKIQEQLSRVGVRVKLQRLEMRTLVGRCLSGDYDAYLGGWTFLGKPDLQPIFGSAFTPPRGSNVVAYRSPDVDRWLEDLEHVGDSQAAESLLVQIQRRIHQDQPYTFLYETKAVAAVGRELSGMRIDIPSDPLARLEESWVTRSAQTHARRKPGSAPTDLPALATD